MSDETPDRPLRVGMDVQATVLHPRGARGRAYGKVVKVSADGAHVQVRWDDASVETVRVAQVAEIVRRSPENSALIASWLVASRGQEARRG